MQITHGYAIPHEEHRFFLLLILAGSVGLIIIALIIATSRISSFGRASSEIRGDYSVSISRENSYVFASPLSALANNSNIIRITVFVLNDRGLGSANQNVVLKAPNQIIITPVAPMTDSFGRAIFDLTSDTAGDYTIIAEVQGSSLPKRVVVSFH